LHAWLREVVVAADAAILGLDTLLYGGLIPGRRSPDTLAEVQGRLSSLEGLGVPILAFSVTMRISNSDVAEEEKPYWSEFGPVIHRWSFHADRFDQTGDPESGRVAEAARNLIPDAIAADYLATRKRNFTINQEEVRMAGRGVFDLLCLTQDDTAEFGFNQAEKRALQAMQVPNVLVYPGADEVASVLVGRWINRQSCQRPVFRMEAWPPQAADIVAMYEDRPLARTVAGQVLAVGGRLATDPAPADAVDEKAIDLVLNGPATRQGDLALRIGLEGVDAPPRDLEGLRVRLAGSSPVALADVAYANGADPLLWDALLRDGSIPPCLAAFAAWNTAGNTIGTVVAMASAWLAGPADPRSHAAFLDARLADDLFYEAMLRKVLRDEDPEGICDEAVLGERLAALWRLFLPAEPIQAIKASFPWGRTFEAAVQVVRPPEFR
jgi:hypothetical protein